MGCLGMDIVVSPSAARAAACARPTRAIAVVFARRPDTFALVLNGARRAVLHRLDPPQGRQFNGHGAFSAEGLLLLTSEVGAEGSAGRVVLWDTRGFRRLRKRGCGGIAR